MPPLVNFFLLFSTHVPPLHLSASSSFQLRKDFAFASDLIDLFAIDETWFPLYQPMDRGIVTMLVPRHYIIPGVRAWRRSVNSRAILSPNVSDKVKKRRAKSVARWLVKEGHVKCHRLNFRVNERGRIGTKIARSIRFRGITLDNEALYWSRARK